MINLPKVIFRFFYWWFLTTPFWLFNVSKRILIIFNNEVSFALNLKMFFVPLFHDFTWVGRGMGVVYRTIKIVIGSLILAALFVAAVLVNVSWVLLPVMLFVVRPYIFAVFIAFLFTYWEVFRSTIPWKKVSEVSSKKKEKSFRPQVGKFLRIVKKDKKKALEYFFAQSHTTNILNRLELGDTVFMQTLLNTIPFDSTKLDKDSFSYAKDQKARYVELEHLFLAILVNIENYDSFLDKYSLSFETCKRAVNWEVSYRDHMAKVYFWQQDYETPVMGGVDRALTGRVTPDLDAVSSDFTRQAQEGAIPPIFGHQDAQQQVVDLLGNSDRENVLIIGPPGCGKTSLVKGIAIRIIEGTKEGSLKFKRLVSIESGSLISGARSAGEISGRIKKVIEDVRGSRGIILFFDEIHNLVVADSGSESTIFALLEPHISSGGIQIIGATNLENYRRYIEPNGSFSGLFQTVEIGPTSNEETLQILEDVARRLEAKYNVQISFVALQETIELTERLIHERVFPDKALDILDRTVARISKGTKFVTGEDIAVTVSSITHVPVTTLNETEADKLLNIEQEMGKHVIGQGEALNRIAKALKRGRVGIRSQGKPIASFLFVGTTGVGKTETAKTLAKLYFGDEEAMIRLDMSEYQQADSINRLIGTPDGRTKGQLTNKVRSMPFSLILLDEIEKAYSDILLAFLQVLDDGRLTDSTGRVVDFTHSIIIATSNVGTRSLQKIFKKQGSFKEMSEIALNDVRAHFAPEFLNRFSSIVVYRPLGRESVRKIAHIMLETVKKMTDKKGIKISFKDDLVSEIVKRGHSPEWGARPLARVIEDSVETHIAEKILEKKFRRGDTVELGMEVFNEE